MEKHYFWGEVMKTLREITMVALAAMVLTAAPALAEGTTEPDSPSVGGPQGNNGHGNGDQGAPGNSGDNNNAENSENAGEGNSGNGQGGRS
jgi:hypothetical protein